MKPIHEVLPRNVIEEQSKLGSKVVICPICGNETFDDYFICPTCKWEYDESTEYSSVNKMTLKEYKENYLKKV